MNLNQPFSACEVKKVRSIQFGTFDPDFIKRFSVCEIQSVELYDNGVPKAGGLNDPKMGTTDYRVPCKTCSQDLKGCPGHFGHMTLSRPVFHVGFLGVVLNVLNCVCYSCSRILADYDDPRFMAALRIKNPKTRLAAVLNCCKTKRRCEGTNGDNPTVKSSCGAIQPKYSKDCISITVKFPAESEDNICEMEENREVKEDTKRNLSASEALAILRRITPVDQVTLGFNPERSNPCWMIIQNLLVVPPAVRPYVQFGIDRSEDDLTLKLLDVLKTNIQIKKQEEGGVPNHIIAETEGLLQYHVATMFNNEIPGLPVAATKSKKPIKSIRERLKGKEGRFRGNLMGKRVDFSARTVITGDPNLLLDEVGVPLSIAMNLTFPEEVTSMNMEEMKRRVANGPAVWPGARYIILPDGTRFDLRHSQGNPSVLNLEPGCKVERHMENGDFVLFNRQPSLHKMSIMGHRARVLPWSTFRVNLSVTKPYNADFDGDEMNMHLAQSQETRAEIKHLCLVPMQIVSPQGNRPVMGIVQDSLVGIAKLTSRETFIPRDLMMTLCMAIPYWKGEMPVPAILRPVELWTGKQLVTLLMNFGASSGSAQTSGGTINLMRGSAYSAADDSEWFSKSDGSVIIRNSEHLAGIICKNTVGSSAGSLVHVMWHDCGPERAKLLLSAAQRVVNEWLVTQAFSVGISDMMASDLVVKDVKECLTAAGDRVDKLIAQARKGLLETQPGKSLMESLETRLNQELNAARESAGKIAAESLSQRNNMIAMLTSGSKGSTINVSQIMACVGQQNVEGKRIPFGFKDRALPHFMKHDYSPHARGFVVNSYLSGLTPHELFFHAMGGREGIIDTACKTSETGYIQRRLIKAMEDVLVAYDKTVRTSAGDLIQFLYGEDGMAGEYIEDQQIQLMQMNFKEMEANFKHDYDNPKYAIDWIPDAKLRESLSFGFDNQAILDAEWEKLLELKKQLSTEIYPEGESKQHLPCNISRLLRFAKNKFLHETQSAPLSPIDIIKKVDHLLTFQLQKLMLGQGNHPITALEAFRNSTIVFNAHVRTHLNSRKLLEKDKIGSHAFEWLLGEIHQLFQKALAHPGEVVGAIAAQSIGEPATQMTLNTFHFAGVSSKNVTLGVPRLKELINVSKTVKTPSLTVFLDNKIACDQEVAKSVQTHLEHTSLEKITAFAQVVFDPDPLTSIIEEDRHWVQEYYEFPDDEEFNPARLGRWVLRIQLLDQLIIDKQLSMKEIGQKIISEFSEEELELIWTDDNCEKLVLRIRLKLTPEQMLNKSVDDPQMFNADDLTAEKDSENEHVFLYKLMSQCLAGITLRGITNITKVYMREVKIDEYDCEKGEFSKNMKSKWVLDTDGCNLQAVMAAPNVDFTRTVSNKILEILSVLGIEAARKALLRELRAVISFDGSYVNYRHLAILCDTMTQRGHLMPITRNGINRGDRGCLAKCSFEETVEILVSAAAFSEVDHLRGVTETVMIGQLGNFGTGMCDILIDHAKLKDPALHFETSGVQQFGQPDAGSSSPFGFDSPVSSVGSSISPKSASLKHFVMSPFSPNSPEASLGASISSPLLSSQFSPVGVASPTSPTSPTSPRMGSGYPMSPTQGIFSPTNLFSPFANPASPTMYSPTSPVYGTQKYGVVMSPSGQVSSPSSPSNIMSPSYSPSSPTYSPTSPTYSPTSPTYSPTSPTYSPTSPTYSPTSPTYSPTSPTYSPTSPTYSPTSPTYSPTSPTYSPTSPTYSPMSPMYSPTSPGGGLYSPQSPSYSPLSPGGVGMSLASPRGAQVYSPNAAAFGYGAQNPQSPGAYSPMAMNYSPTAMSMSPSSPMAAPMSPIGLQSPRYDPAAGGSILRHTVDDSSPRDDDE